MTHRLATVERCVIGALCVLSHVVVCETSECLRCVRERVQ